MVAAGGSRAVQSNLPWVLAKTHWKVRTRMCDVGYNPSYILYFNFISSHSTSFYEWGGLEVCARMKNFLTLKVNR